MRELLELIRQLAEEDKRTIMISSHQLQQIQQVCDRVGIFVKGKLIACGPIETLGQQLEKEGHFVTEIQAEPMDERLPQLLESIETVKAVNREGQSLIIDSTEDIRKEMGRRLVEQGYALLGLKQKGGELDEIYRQYFGGSLRKQKKRNRKSSKKKHYDQRQGLIALYNKEMTDHFRSKRILIVLALIGLTSFASLYGALVITSYSEVEFLFLQLYTASGNSIPSFVSFIALLGPFVGLALGFDDGIIGEKSERTLYRLTSQPIYRDSIINGKFWQEPQSL